MFAVSRVRALSEVHGARQDRIHEGEGRADELAANLDQRICRRQSGDVVGGHKGAQAAGRSEGRGHRKRGKPGLLQRPLLPAAALPAGSDGHRPEPGLAPAGRQVA